MYCISFFFFFQAEDGIRDYKVTGVQTCALPIFSADPLDGSLFLFLNRRRDRLKILHFDGAGFWLYYRLLEAGTFEVIESDAQCLKIDAAGLAMLLAGVPLKTAKRRKRYQRATKS